jgi:hypothetical protein
MYSKCQVCRRSLGHNTAITHMPVGRRLAYDAARGRLWIVCAKCQEWSLTPLEERWEALEECERLFATATVHVASRAPSSTIGLAQCGDVELLRIGDAPRDEIANARYGPRLLRRQARRRRLTTVAGIGAGAVVGALVLFGTSTGSIQATAYLAAAGLFYACLLGWFARDFRLAHFRRADGSAVWLTTADLQTVTVPPQRTHHELSSTDLTLWNGKADERFYHESVLAPLAAALPALNAGGGSLLTIAAAVKLVDEAEAAIRREAPNPTSLHDRKGRTAWQRLLQGTKGADAYLYRRPLVERLALEMAVAEELERSEMAEEVAIENTRVPAESEVADIADNMFVPQGIVDWIARYKSKSRVANGP